MDLVIQFTAGLLVGVSIALYMIRTNPTLARKLEKRVMEWLGKPKL